MTPLHEYRFDVLANCGCCGLYAADLGFCLGVAAYAVSGGDRLVAMGGFALTVGLAVFLNRWSEALTEEQKMGLVGSCSYSDAWVLGGMIDFVDRRRR